MKTLPKPSGNTKDLPDTGGTTMWNEADLQCLNDTSHKISGSTRKVYCYDCGIYWDRNKFQK